VRDRFSRGVEESATVAFAGLHGFWDFAQREVPLPWSRNLLAR